MIEGMEEIAEKTKKVWNFIQEKRIATFKEIKKIRALRNQINKFLQEIYKKPSVVTKFKTFQNNNVYKSGIKVIEKFKKQLESLDKVYKELSPIFSQGRGRNLIERIDALNNPRDNYDFVNKLHELVNIYDSRVLGDEPKLTNVDSGFKDLFDCLDNVKKEKRVETMIVLINHLNKMIHLFNNKFAWGKRYVTKAIKDTDVQKRFLTEYRAMNPVKKKTSNQPLKFKNVFKNIICLRFLQDIKSVYITGEKM